MLTTLAEQNSSDEMMTQIPQQMNMPTATPEEDAYVDAPAALMMNVHFYQPFFYTLGGVGAPVIDVPGGIGCITS